MQNSNDPDKDNDNDGEQEKDRGEFAPKWLPRWLFTLIGPLALLVVVVGSVAAYYAYHYVTKDSVRAQFWVGFMFSFMALVVVLVQVVIYAKQAEFMKQQATASSQLIDLMVINERAYVAIAGVQPPQIIGNVLTVDAMLANGGRTPAWGFTRKLRIGIVGIEESPAPPPDWNTVEESDVGLILAGKEVPFNFPPAAISDERIEKLLSGQLKLVLDGQVRYFDSLGGVQFYEFGFSIFASPWRSIQRYQAHRREKANLN